MEKCDESGRIDDRRGRVLAILNYPTDAMIFRTVEDKTYPAIYLNLNTQS